MRTYLTYQYHEGNIWRWVQMGVIRIRWEPILTERLLAGQLLAQHTESANQNDYFAKRAAELRDEIAEAIREYDEFHQQYQPSNDPGSYGMGKEINHGCHI